MKKNILLWYFIGIFCIFSCHQKTQPQQEEPVIISYPKVDMPRNFSTKNYTSDSVFTLPENIFIPSHLFQKTNCLNSKLLTQAVKQWSVLKQLNYSEKYKIWLLLSDRKDACLLLTLTENDDVIDCLPIALNLCIQNNDIIEQEKWVSEFTDSGTFIISKDYEYSKSINDIGDEYYQTHQEEFSKTQSQKDKFHLEEDGHFSYIEVSEDENYNAIIFFNDQINYYNKWYPLMEEIQTYCEEKNIYMIEAYHDFKKVPIYNYVLDTLDIISIQKNVDKYHLGILLSSRGKPCRYIDINTDISVILKDIEHYFKIQF